MRIRQSVIVPIVVALVLLTSCASSFTATQVIETRLTKQQPIVQVAARSKLNTAKKRMAFHRFIVMLQLRAYLHAVWLAVYSIPPYLHHVAVCVKGHESGNYSESSHTSSGSGAYQFIPSTWRTYFAAWAKETNYKGPWYAFAFQAPWYVQDAVFVYTVTHGGAHNWDPKFGWDPCTVSMAA